MAKKIPKPKTKAKNKASAVVAPEEGGPLGGVAPPSNSWLVNAFVPQRAVYYDGDQNAPYDWDQGDAYGLQLALVAAGYMSKSSVENLWTNTAANAYKQALADANRHGMTVEELLSALAEGGSGGGGGGGGLGPRPATDEDVIALANKVAQGVMGRKLRTEEVNQFLPAFRGVEFSGTAPQVSAENIIMNETAPVESRAFGIGNVMQAVEKLLGG